MKHEDIKKMLEEISPWPWKHVHRDYQAVEIDGTKLKDVTHVSSKDNESVVTINHTIIDDSLVNQYESPTSTENYKFIAKAPEILDQLLKENEELRTRGEGLNDVLLTTEHANKAYLKENKILRKALECYADEPGKLRAKEVLDKCEEKK